MFAHGGIYGSKHLSLLGFHENQQWYFILQYSEKQKGEPWFIVINHKPKDGKPSFIVLKIKTENDIADTLANIPDLVFEGYLGDIPIRKVDEI